MKTFIIAYFILFGFAETFAFFRYEVDCDPKVLHFSRKILFEQVGVRERTNRNDGVQIEKYLAELNLPKGSPYCVAGQYYCFAESVRRLSSRTERNPLPKTGLSTKMFKELAKKGKRSGFLPRCDDLIFWQRGTSRFGHCERIIRVGAKGWVTTVGFNTKRYDPISKKFVEGVFVQRRNLLAPFGHLNLLGLVGFGR